MPASGRAPGRTGLTGRLSRGQLTQMRRKVADNAGLDRETLLQLYVEQERSICDIASHTKTRPRTVLAALVAHGIPLRSGGAGWLPPARGGRS